MNKKLGDLMQSNKAVMRRCVAAFFWFLFLRVENKSKENCKNLGTDRTLA